MFFYIDIPNDPCLHIVKKYSFLFLNCYVFQKSIKKINFNVTQAILCDHKWLQGIHKISKYKSHMNYITHMTYVNYITALYNLHKSYD